MKRTWTTVGAVLACVVGVAALLDAPEAKPIQLPPIDCTIVLCPAPICPVGSKPVTLPGDCCPTCVPTT